MRPVAIAVLCVAACVGLGVAACAEGRGAPPPPRARTLAVTPLPAATERGVCFAHAWGRGSDRGYGSDAARGELDRLRGDGATAVSVTPFGWVEALDASEVHVAGTHGPGETDTRVAQVIADAHARGLHVLLKPHLWVGRGDWVSELRPGSWDDFFASYRAFVLHYAALGERTHAEELAVGVELGSSEAHEAAWRALIAAVRAAYHGRLVYAASWDRAARVPFWDALDDVGVQLYAPLVAHDEDETHGDEPAMRARLDAVLDDLDALSTRVGRPLLVTEAGFKSARGALARPWLWSEQVEGTAPDPALQACGYRVLFAALGARPRVRGVYLWKWFTAPDTTEEGALGFAPRGKPAEAVLRSAFAAPARGRVH